jgi:hypothetical protein
MLNGEPSSARPTSPVLLAARFLLPTDESRYADAPQWKTAGRWFIVWGLLTGILYAVVFRVTWRWFGEYQGIRWLPAAAVLTTDLALCGYRLLMGVIRLTGDPQKPESSGGGALTLPQLLTVMLIIITKYAMLLSLPQGISKSSTSSVWQVSGWLRWLRFLYPTVIYRPLVLMPLWGRWAVFLAASIGRVAPAGSGRLRTMAGGLSLRMVFGQWLLVSVLTALYCRTSVTDLARGVAVSIGLMLAVYLTSFILARRAGGQSESTVCTAGLVGELAFLALYLAVINNMYWW